MIEMRIQFSGEDLAKWRQLQAQFPAEMIRANGRAASIVRRKMRAALKKGGGTKDVPALAPLHPVTMELTGRALPGGKLAQPELVVMYRLGKAQIVGWPDGLTNYASAFQSAQSSEMSKSVRHYMHRRRVKGIPSWYARPARPVVEPLLASVAPQYTGWFQGAAVKLIEKSLAKQGF